MTGGRDDSICGLGSVEAEAGPTRGDLAGRGAEAEGAPANRVAAIVEDDRCVAVDREVCQRRRARRQRSTKGCAPAFTNAIHVQSQFQQVGVSYVDVAARPSTSFSVVVVVVHFNLRKPFRDAHGAFVSNIAIADGSKGGAEPAPAVPGL